MRRFLISVVVALTARGPRTTRVTWCAWCAVAMNATAAAITVASTALCTNVIADSAIISKLHWTVAVIFSLQPFQREYVAVSRARYADIAWRARLLDHSPFPAVITGIRVFIARLTASVSQLAASLRRVYGLTARVTVLASGR